MGVLVQTNYGGVLTVERRSGRAGARASTRSGEAAAPMGDPTPDGSIMIVVATDAPLDARLLERLARRAGVGLARTGATISNGSGDYVIAFTTAESARRRQGSLPLETTVLRDDAMTPLFQAVAEATEEAIYNSLFRATTTTGAGGTVEALPIAATLDVLRRHGALTTE